MLIKINNGSGGWHLLDNVDRVNLPGKNTEVRKPDDLAGLVAEGHEMINLVPREALAGNQPAVVGVVEALRNGQWSTCLFTSVAYICNDRGDTIEVVNVRKFQKERRR